MWRSRMFWRLFGAYGVLLLAAIALLGTVVTARLQRHYEQQIADNLRTRAYLVSEFVREWPAERASLLQARIQEQGAKINARITLIDRDGRVLADSEEDPRIMENHGQ